MDRLRIPLHEQNRVLCKAAKAVLLVETKVHLVLQIVLQEGLHLQQQMALQVELL